MSEVLLLAGAHTRDENAWAPLKISCERLDVPFFVCGTNNPKSNFSNDPQLFMDCVKEALEILTKTPEPYIIISDAYDVLASRWNEDELIDRIEESLGKLLISCEANCFPNGRWKSLYDSDLNLSESPWRYANGGQFCGRKDKVINLMEVLRNRMKEATTGGANEILHILWTEGFPFTLDYECKIFQSMYTDESRHVIKHFNNGNGMQVLNTFHQTYPMFLHFNGRAPGMPEWYKALTGKDYRRNSIRPEYGGVQ